MSDAVKVKTIKCPACKRRDGLVGLMVKSVTRSVYYVDSGYREEEPGSAEAYLMKGITAICACGNEWKLRGVRCLDELSRD